MSKKLPAHTNKKIKKLYSEIKKDNTLIKMNNTENKVEELLGLSAKESDKTKIYVNEKLVSNIEIPKETIGTNGMNIYLEKNSINLEDYKKITGFTGYMYYPLFDIKGK